MALCDVDGPSCRAVNEEVNRTRRRIIKSVKRERLNGRKRIKKKKKKRK